VLEWLPGRPLAGDLLTDGAALAGEALAQLHAIPPLLLPLCTRDAELRRVLQSVETVGWLLPDARGSALRLAQQIARRLPRDVHPVIAHGDFSADQVLVHHDRVAVVDLDEAVLSDPLRDLGSFLAALGREVVAGRLAEPAATAAQDELLAGYGRVDRTALQAWTATALLHLAPEPFRQREPDWPARVLELLALAERLLEA
jgi:aminoglycoside phosphotransferase (APT) family kinase protein